MLFKKIDPNSKDTIVPGLDLFSTPMTQVAIEKTEEREFLLKNPIESPPYIFQLNTANQMMDPKSIKIMTRWSIKIKEGSTWRNLRTEDSETTGTSGKQVIKQDYVAPINGFGACWIKVLKVMFSGQTVFDSDNYYAYKACLDNELCFSEDSKKSSMNTFCYYYDPHGKKGQKERASFKARRDLFAGDGTSEDVLVEFISPIYADIFQQPNFILSNLDIQIDITPYHKEFLLIAPEYTDDTAKNIKLELDFIRLYANFVDLNAGVMLEIERKLASEPAVYAVRRTVMKSFFSGRGKTEDHVVLFSDYIPRQCILVFNKNKDYNGAIDTDPMEFINGKIRYIQIKAGNMNVPNVLWELDFDKGQYVRAFDFFHRTVGLSGNNLDCGINREMYKDGYTIFAFNLTTSQEDDEGFNFIREGPTIAHIRWGEAIPDMGYNCVVMGIFDSLLKIDLSRSVYSDLQA